MKDKGITCFVDGCNNNSSKQVTFLGKVCFPCSQLAVHLNEGDLRKRFYIERKATRFIIDNYEEVLKQAGINAKEEKE